MKVKPQFNMYVYHNTTENANVLQMFIFYLHMYLK